MPFKSIKTVTRKRAPSRRAQRGVSIACYKTKDASKILTLGVGQGVHRALGWDMRQYCNPTIGTGEDTGWMRFDPVDNNDGGGMALFVKANAGAKQHRSHIARYFNNGYDFFPSTPVDYRVSGSSMLVRLPDGLVAYAQAQDDADDAAPAPRVGTVNSAREQRAW